MFGDEAYQVERAKTIIDSFCLDALKRSYLTGSFTMENDGSAYTLFGKKYQPPLLLDREYGVCRVSMDKDGNLHYEVAKSFNEVCLDVLRKLNRNKMEILYYSKHVYEFTFRIWRLAEHNKEKENEQLGKNLESFSFSFQKRYEVAVPDFIGESWEKRAVIYDREVLRNFEGNLPQPAADSLKTYNAEGEYYVCYGGMIPMKNVPQQTIDELLELAEKHGQLGNKPRDQYIKELDDCFYLSDSIWKFHIIEERWELMSPDTSFHNNSDAHYGHIRPMGELMMAFLHHERKHIYYLCESFTSPPTWGPLYEYDYQNNRFRMFDLGYKVSTRQRLQNGVINFSNDTLLLSIVNPYENVSNVLVFCFQTQKSILIKLKHNTNISLFNTEILLFDNFEKLVYIHRRSNKWCDHVDYVDWGNVKRKTLNRFLQVYRS